MSLYRSVRSALGRVKRGVRRRISGERAPNAMWVETSRAMISRPLRDFRFYAIIGTWYESDVIEATVKHAFAQGCDRVYLVDNDSPDDTVRRAVDAGAILAAEFSSEGYDEMRRIGIMNDVVARISGQDSAEHIWWLWLDADEFPNAPGGLTLREFLARLDRRYRVVGATRVDHFPTSRPQYVTGFHPLEFMPMCEVFSGSDFSFCGHGHWKHPLQRFDRQGPSLRSGGGFHTAVCDKTLMEPPVVLWQHHFPYRDQSFTERRMQTLCAPKAGGVARSKQFDEFVGGTGGVTKRFRTMQNVYAGNWDQVENLKVSGNPLGVRPKPYRSILPPEDGKVHRWYSEAELAAAIRAHS